jgi:hypothetical protein
VNWRAAALVREAWLNSLANLARTATIVLIAGAAVGLLSFLELREAEEARAFVERFTASGGYVVIALSQGEPIDAGRCEALNEATGIVAAGSVRPAGAVSFSSAPGLPFQSASVTAGILNVWQPGMRVAPAPAGGSMIAGSVMAKELGLGPGSYAARSGESPLLVAAVLEAARRNPQVQRWALEVAPPAGPADQCWVEFDRNSYDTGPGRLAAWFATGATEPAVRPYIRRDEFTRDPAPEFGDRPTRFGWLAAGGLVSVVLALAAWFRRAELGLYLALGAPRSKLWVLIALETALVIVIASVVGLLWALAVHRATHNPLPWDHVRLALSSGLSAALLALVVTPWLALLVARGNIAALLKER